MIGKTRTFCLFLCLLTPGVYANELDKLQFIQSHLNAEARHSRLWQNSWLTVIAADSVINAAGYSNADNHREQVDSGTALAVGLLGLYSGIKNPMQIHHYQQTLSSLPQNTSAEISNKLNTAEQMLNAAASREAHEQSRKNRVTSGVIHAIAALIVNEKGSGEKQAIRGFLSGLAFGELKIRTAPKQSIEALKRYQSGDIIGSATTADPYWNIGFNGTMLSARLNF